MQGTTQFQYRPLPGPDYIRLLLLNSADEHEDVTASIGEVSVNQLHPDIPPYTPLSYSWGRNEDGDTLPSRHIFMNGCRVEVTENLFDALVHLRRHIQTGLVGPLFWIDALCINQTDDLERSSQVAIMDRIYAHGINTAIWLGEDHKTGEDDLAFEVLKLFEQELDLYNDKWPISRATPTTLASDLLRMAGPLIMRYGSDGHGPTHMLPSRVKPYTRMDRPQWNDLFLAIDTWCVAVYNVLRRRYFWRRWVIQEIYSSASQPIFVLWGHHIMVSTVFVDFIEQLLHALTCLEQLGYIGALKTWLERAGAGEALFENLHDLHPSGNRAFDLLRVGSARSQILTSTSTASALENGPWHEFLLILHGFSETDCKDPRDRIYALHSLLKAPASLQPDYGISIESLYKTLPSRS
jgi:hypothetical protein